MRCELRLDTRQLARIEAKVAAQFGRPVGAVQIEERFLPIAAYVYVRWPMVACVYDDAEPVDPEHNRHRSSIPYSQPLGLFYAGAVRLRECLHIPNCAINAAPSSLDMCSALLLDYFLSFRKSSRTLPIALSIPRA